MPQSAHTEYQKPQHPDGQLSGNFSIALLLGGEGTPAGKSLPDPLEALPPRKESASQAAFDQRSQVVQGSQTNIQGNVRGPVFSGTFQGPVNTGSGNQVQVRDIHASGGNVNIAGGDVVQNTTISDNRIK